MSSTFSASITVAPQSSRFTVDRHRRRFHCLCSGGNPQSLESITTTTGGPHHPIRRREASAALGGIFISRLLDPAVISPFRLAPPPAQAAAEPPPQCQLTVAPSGLAYCDSIVGTGAEATKGQLIKAHYVGRLESGKVFDSSYGRGKPLTFRVGVGEVIKGWDQGILGGDGIPPMLAGGKRSLKLPPEFAYGMRGAGCKGGSCVIPPDSTLLFDVEFIGKA